MESAFPFYLEPSSLATSMLPVLRKGGVYVAFLLLFQTRPLFGELSKSKLSKLYGDEAESRCEPSCRNAIPTLRDISEASRGISVSTLRDVSQATERYRSAP